MSLPITILENVLHPEMGDYHNPKDLETISKLRCVVKDLEATIERYSKKEDKVSSEQNDKRQAKTNNKKKASQKSESFVEH